MPVPAGPMPITTTMSCALTGVTPGAPLMAAMASASLVNTRAAPRWV